MVISFKLRLKVYMRDCFCCRYCGKAMNPLSDDLTLDHVHPDGNSTEENLVTACLECNTRKGAKPVEEFKAQLITEAQRRLEERRAPASRKRKALHEILRDVSFDTGLSIANIRGRQRNRPNVDARTIFSLRARDEGYSFPEIGLFLGMHHTTVVHMVQKVESTSFKQSVLLKQEISTPPTVTAREVSASGVGLGEAVAEEPQA